MSSQKLDKLLIGEGEHMENYKEKFETMENVFVLIFTLIAIPLSVVINGLVFLNMYTWFIVETFGLPKINILTAIGLMTIFIFLKSGDSLSNDEKIKQTNASERVTLVFRGLVSPLFYLLYAYIIHLFV